MIDQWGERTDEKDDYICLNYGAIRNSPDSDNGGKCCTV